MVENLGQEPLLTDAQWTALEPLLPSSHGTAGRNFTNNRVVVEGMLYRLRTGVPWRGLPARFGLWKTVWKRHRRYIEDGTWERILAVVGTPAPPGAGVTPNTNPVPTPHPVPHRPQ
ncbi:transposase (plasmid) [Rhodococcus opacus]|uniref:transposase n=1 Tax=Rhodococcus TaxID=1827 RepID=UPI0034D384F7